MNTDFYKQQAQEMHEFDEMQKHQREAFEAKQKERAEREQRRLEERKKQEEFEERLISSIVNPMYGFNRKQAEMIFNKAWEEGHAYGYREVENDFDELVDWMSDFLKLKKDEYYFY